MKFITDLKYGCSLTLAGFGYPYTEVTGPNLPVTLEKPVDCDLWWNEVDTNSQGDLYMTGHRIAEFVAFATEVRQAIAKAYANIDNIRCVGSYYRTDIGDSKWPPGML